MPSEIEVFRAMLKASPEMQEKLRELVAAGKLRPFDSDTATDGETMLVVASGDHCGITGSKQARCECGKPVWVSPSTQAMIIERGVNPTRVICTVCFLGVIERRREKIRTQ